MKIAMLTYSVKPRGGVVHALQVSEALARGGHEPRLVALSRDGEGFFRAPAVPATLIAVSAARRARRSTIGSWR